MSPSPAAEPLIQAQVCVEADRAGQRGLCAASRRWFERAVPALGGDLWRRLLSREVAPADEPYRWGGSAGDVWAECAVEFPMRGPTEYYPHDPEAWQYLLDSTEDYSTALNFSVYELAELLPGRLYPGFPRLSVSARYIDRRSNEWWGFKVQATRDLLVCGEQRQRVLLDQVRAVAETPGVAYAEISYDSGSHVDFATSLEHNLDMYPWHTVLASRRRLRGYGWLTVLSRQIGDRLGGVDGLWESGAFAQAEQLPNGSYWLLATPLFEEYGPAQAARVQRVLAPALPPGLPRPDREGESPHLLALTDAQPGKRRLDRDRDEIFKNRLDPRFGPDQRVAVGMRVAALRERFPEARIRVAGDDDGPNLICWGARPGRVFVWQFLPEDDAYAGMDIMTLAGTGLAEVAADPLSGGMAVVPGPPFAELGIPETSRGSESRTGACRVTVYDAVPGLQLYYREIESGPPDR